MDHSPAARRLALLRWHLEWPASTLQGCSSVWVPRQEAEATQRTLRLAACSAAAAAAGAAESRRGAVVLIGGMVMDLQAHPSGPADVQRGGSVPGRVAQSAGGVARNVAESLALLLGPSSSRSHSPPWQQREPPLLISVVGEDMQGAALLQHWRGLGLSTAGIAQLPGERTPTVAVVFDLGGEVAACVADVELLERRLTPALLCRPLLADALAHAPLLMLDGNLSPPAIEEAATQAAAAGVPVWFEPVSVPKAVRATTVLRHMAYISPNAQELAAMAAAVRKLLQQGGGELAAGQRRLHGAEGQRCSGSRTCTPGCCGVQQPSLSSAAGASAAAAVGSLVGDLSVLLGAGVGHVVLTLGAQGAALCTLTPDRRHVTVHHLPALPAKVVNCSGAGDCLVAGCLYALASGAEPIDALAHGVAAAKAAVESASNVPEGLSAAGLQHGVVSALAGLSTAQLCCCCCCCCCCGRVIA